MVTAAIILTFSFLEQSTLKNNFAELSQEISIIKEKAYDETLSVIELTVLIAVPLGVICAAFQNKWIKSKEVLHVYIPHNEIKELDLWISECLYYAKEKDFTEVKAKAEVIAELFEQIPKTFSVKIENLL